MKNLKFLYISGKYNDHENANENKKEIKQFDMKNCEKL